MTALSDEEQTIIHNVRQAGDGVMTIRRVLRSKGFRRGTNIIQAFLDDQAYPPLRHHASSNQSTAHNCAFCSWKGAYNAYYAHWRINHRTRAGLSRADVQEARHA